MAATSSNQFLLYGATQRLTFGCRVIDNKFGGGVQCKGITEIVAESGAGKTQMALQMLLTAQLPRSDGGLEGCSLYLHAEKPFPYRRLKQLAENRPNLTDTPMDRVFVEHIDSVERLIDVLLRVDGAVQSSNIKLIIIDSIAGLFRGVFSMKPEELALRKKFYYKIAALLKDISKKYGIAVVVTNQVMDFISADCQSRAVIEEGLISSGRIVKPALGLYWANCVDCRIFLKLQLRQQERREGTITEVTTRRRMMEVIFGPYVRQPPCEFIITRQGLKGIEQS